MPAVSGAVVGKTYCPGSGTKAVKKGSKKVGASYRYLCPDCGKHYSTDYYGRINKHGYKRSEKEKTHSCFCGKCKKTFESLELDYLCPKCRG